jgi:hypothetical protein
MLSRSTLALALFAALLPLAARADAVPDAAQKAITADYSVDCTAFTDPSETNLSKAFGSMAPSFVNIDLKGKQTQHDEFIAQAKQQIKQVHVTACDNNLDAWTAPDASTVTVVVTGKFSGQLQAPDGNHDLDATSKSQDTWKVQGDGTWLLTQSKEISNLVKIDGKVVQDEGN